METQGYIVTHKNGPVIDGIGASIEEAMEEPLSQGADIEDLVFFPATPDLLALVELRGGDISWGMVEGIACTDEEEEANVDDYLSNVVWRD